MLKSLKMIQKCFTNSRNWDTMKLTKVTTKKKGQAKCLFFVYFFKIVGIL